MDENLYLQQVADELESKLASPLFKRQLAYQGTLIICLNTQYL